MNEDPILGRVTGADAVTALYGRWRSFHDAAVERIVLERAGPTITIEFLVNDLVIDPATGQDLRRDRRARVRLRWDEVVDCTLSGVDYDENNWIDELRLVECFRGAVCGILVRMHGTHGFVVGRRLDVASAEPLDR